ncbi:MAG: trigger factor [Bacteroidetes bacterium]|nr:MAG: trigger factor [Bacteroidota bacterium]
MNITRESTGELTATIRMEITPDDYQETVTKNLKDYQRKANIPGFRPGKVPFGLVKKMYGKAVMADEINKLLSERLSGYLTEEKLDVLGNPLPNKERIKPARFEDGETLDFYFDIGLAPEFTLNLGPGLEVENYAIKVDDKMVDGYIEDVRKRNGNYTHPESPGDEDMISGEVIELAADGTPVEDVEPKKTYFSLDKVTGKEAIEKLKTVKKGEWVVLKPADWFGSNEEAAKQLGLQVEKLSKPDVTFSLSITEITHVEPAELNAGFFAKVYPGEPIDTEEDFRERVRKDAAASFTGETDKMLYQEITKSLLEDTVMNLPDDFLKRWLYEHEENKMTEEDIGKNYSSFARSMKWQLIENRLIKEYDIHVKEEEIRGYIRTYMLRQVSQEFVDPEMARKYETIVDAFMQNKEQVQKINDQLFDAKLMQLFREKVTLKPVEVTNEEFIKLASEKHDHDHEEM